MRRALAATEHRLLPRGWRDALRQVLLFVGTYLLYQIVRGLVDGNDVARASWNATKVIDLERTLHVFVEPSVQAWALGDHWIMDIADWTYLNAHYAVSIGALLFIYMRRNDSFYFVRNMFMIAMMIALVGYAVYPTAPPRLMPEWGFTDAIQQFTGVTAEQGPSSALLNLYAAIPSMHVCFALMTGLPMARLVRPRPAKIAWCVYPVFIAFVVIVTGNHYLTDVFLGALTAVISALAAAKLLARARPDAWAFYRRRRAAAGSAGQATA
ncbi:MAG: phosphatase PAP2 family protein [Solirubrobacterales bacterium]|nr:phosphatase PAP2 family protein [Solirubrobacterales bacterium]